MALEITKEFATENGLSEEQVTAVTGLVNPWHDSELATSKLEWNGKANKDAEGILNGAITGIETTTNVKRNEGEKAMDYFPRAWELYSKEGNTKIDALRLDLEAKLKDGDGDAGLKTALEELNVKHNAALEKYANYDELSETAAKYDPLREDYEKMKTLVTFGNVKPNFPDTVDEFRVTAKWNEFIDRTEKDWIIDVDKDGNSIAKEKENEFNIVKLKSLVDKDEEISKLLEGRQQKGTGGKEKNLKDLEGIPFQVPVGGDSTVISKLVNDHLMSTGKYADSLSNGYALEFQELYNKVKAGMKG